MGSHGVLAKVVFWSKQWLGGRKYEEEVPCDPLETGAGGERRLQRVVSCSA